MGGKKTDRIRVHEYMTEDVVTVPTEMSVGDAAQMMHCEDAHSGFPVVDDDGHVVGFVTASDLLLAPSDHPVTNAMTRDLLVARPDMKIKNAARVILRSGIQRLPVVDDDGRLVGIISHADVVRAEIERTSPRKVQKLRDMLEMVHDADIDIVEGTVTIDALVPTQGEVYADELEGRQYELEKGLAEPLVVIDYGDETVLADGHHRALAANRIDKREMNAYIVRVDRDEVDLGMRETARKEGLESIADIEVNDYAHHPLIEKTKKWE